MNADLERALLALLTRSTDEVDLDQLVPDPGARDDIGGLRPGAALRVAANATDLTDRVDRFAATQAFVLGSRLRGAADAPVDDGLRELGTALLRPFAGVEAEGRAGSLVDAVSKLARGVPVTAAFADDLTTAFAPQLTVVARSSETIEFDGPAAELVAMLVEVAANFPPRCRSRSGTVLVDGVPTAVTLVEVDVCTSRPFERCLHGIDPTHWPTCNPYFQRVTVLSSQTTVDGWSGAIREEVGPGLNGRVYVTDLSVRYLQQPGLGAVAFDLAPDQSTEPDDGLVTVDRGFLSVTDEGAHRRVRVMKVYRIEDLELPHDWLCPLWAWQVALSGWWC